MPPFFHKARVPPLSTEQLGLKIGNSIDAILQDWTTIMDHAQRPHDYGQIYASNVVFLVAQENGEEGGIKIKGRWCYRIAHTTGSILLRSLVHGRYGGGRMLCFPDTRSHPIEDLLFRWRLETKSIRPEIILGGMARYGFDPKTGLVKDILVDRLVPPFRHNVSLWEYLRDLGMTNLPAPTAHFQDHK